MELVWVDDGEVTCVVGRHRLEVPQGAALVIPAEMEHCVELSASATTSSLWLDRRHVEDTASALGRQTPRPVVLDHAEPVVQLARLVRAEVEQHQPGWSLAVEGLRDALVVAMLRRCPRSAIDKRGGSSDPRIQAAIERIEADYAEPLSVDDLARTAGMSRYHFSRRFRDLVGESPHKFLVRVRVEHAADRLRAGLSVTQVAYEVGFGGLGRFSQAFRARFGVLPSRYAS